MDDDAPGEAPCRECGALLPGWARWCGTCGHPVERPSAADALPGTGVGHGVVRRRATIVVVAAALVVVGARAAGLLGGDEPTAATPVATPTASASSDAPSRPEFAPSPLFGGSDAGPAPVPEPFLTDEPLAVCLVEYAPAPCVTWATRIPRATIVAIEVGDEILLAATNGDLVLVERLDLASGTSLTPGNPPVRYAGLNQPHLVTRAGGPGGGMITVGENSPETGIQLVEIAPDGFPTGVRARIDTGSPRAGAAGADAVVAVVGRDGSVRWIAGDLADVVRTNVDPTTSADVELRVDRATNRGQPLADRAPRLLLRTGQGRLQHVTPDVHVTLSDDVGAHDWAPDGRVVWSEGPALRSQIVDDARDASWRVGGADGAADIVALHATDTVVLVLRADRTLERHDPVTGSLVAPPITINIDPDPAILGVGISGHVFVGGPGGVAAIDPTTGAVVRQVLLVGPRTTVPRLVAVGGRDAIVAVLADDVIALIDLGPTDRS